MIMRCSLICSAGILSYKLIAFYIMEKVIDKLRQLLASIFACKMVGRLCEGNSVSCYPSVVVGGSCERSQSTNATRSPSRALCADVNQKIAISYFNLSSMLLYICKYIRSSRKTKRSGRLQTATTSGRGSSILTLCGSGKRKHSPFLSHKHILKLGYHDEVCIPSRSHRLRVSRKYILQQIYVLYS